MDERQGTEGTCPDSPHPYRLGRGFSLGRNKHFLTVYRRGKRQAGRLMVLTYLRARELKVGFSVSGKVGNAVMRNRIRRMMYDDFRHLRPELRPGRYVISARIPAADATHDQLTREMRYLFTRAGLIKNGGDA